MAVVFGRMAAYYEPPQSGLAARDTTSVLADWACNARQAARERNPPCYSWSSLPMSLEMRSE